MEEDRRSATLQCLMGAVQDCAYLPGRAARSVIVDPALSVDTQLYSRLIDQGFRRSGSLLYRPHCSACKACISLRVNSREFKPRRSQRRIWRRNQDLLVRQLPACFQEEHFVLFQRYLSQRHPTGGMNPPSRTGYRDFLIAPQVDSRWVEFRLAERLVMVAVVDIMAAGLSAVYTFFDPQLKQRGLGVYSILWQIAEARRRGLPWAYLGYWIKECQQMKYKDRFRPCEIYQHNVWIACQQQ